MRRPAPYEPEDGARAEPAWIPAPEPSGRELLTDNVRRRVHSMGRGSATIRRPRASLRTAAVLLAMIAGGLRTLLTSRTQPVDHLVLPILVPVSLRRGTDDAGPGNRISQTRVQIPVGEPDAGERLRRITAATSRTKALSHPSLGPALRNRLLSAIMLRLIIRQRINLLSADIVGPTQPLSFAGCAVRDAFPLINLLGSITLGVGALSYEGRFDVLAVADADLYPDLGIFAAGAADEIRVLVRARAHDRQDAGERDRTNLLQP